MNCWLITNHWMYGVDFHRELGILPACPAPVPFPFHPHFVAASLRWFLRPSMEETVLSSGFPTMQRGTDIQNGIAHIPLPLAPFNLLCLVITAFSGSKSHFGVASVMVKDKPVAVAVDVNLNINLNCGDIPTPTGIVLAPNTVVSQMTRADFLGGVASMLTDAIFQAVVSRMMGGFGVNSWAEGIILTLIGTPLGFSANAGGRGLLGLGGRVFTVFSDYMRGVGESLAGDGAQGQANRDAATRTLLQNVRELFSPPPPSGREWELGRDLETILDHPNRARSAISSAFDNPQAVQF